MSTPRCGCCRRPVTAVQLLCLDCWDRVPANLRREFSRAAARAGRHYGTQCWRAIPEANAVVEAATAKLRRRAEHAINLELF